MKLFARLKAVNIRSHPDGVACVFIYTLFLCTLIQPQVYHDAFVREHRHNHSHEKNKTCKSLNSTEEGKYQKMTSKLILSLSLISFVPLCLATVIGGGLVDLYGQKKALIFIPILGQMIELSSLLLIMHTDLPVKLVAVFAEIIVGFAGGYGLFSAGSYSFLSETTKEKNRTWRMIIFESMMGIGIGLSVVTGGPLADYRGLTAVAILALSLAAANGIYVVFVLKRSTSQAETQTQPPAMTGQSMTFWSKLFYGLRIVWELFQGKRNANRILLFFSIASIGLFILLYSGGTVVLILILRYRPFCFSNTKISLVRGEEVILLLVSMSSSFVLVKKLHFRDETLIALGFLSYSTGCLLMGTAKSTFMVFLAPVGNALHTYVQGAARGMMSKAVPENSQGALFGFVGTVLIASEVVGVATATLIYSKTVRSDLDLPNPASVVYFTLAGISIMAFFGSLIMACLFSKPSVCQHTKESKALLHPATTVVVAKKFSRTI